MNAGQEHSADDQGVAADHRDRQPVRQAGRAAPRPTKTETSSTLSAMRIEIEAEFGLLVEAPRDARRRPRRRCRPRRRSRRPASSRAIDQGPDQSPARRKRRAIVMMFGRVSGCPLPCFGPLPGHCRTMATILSIGKPRSCSQPAIMSTRPKTVRGAMAETTPLTYRDAGVDIDAGNDLVNAIKPHRPLHARGAAPMARSAGSAACST